MDYFAKIKNINLKTALQFRMKGDYVEARKYLDIAFDELDAEAMFFKGEAYYYGGWGYDVDENKSETWLRRSFEAGCDASSTILRYYNALRAVDEILRPIDPTIKAIMNARDAIEESNDYHDKEMYLYLLQLCLEEGDIVAAICYASLLFNYPHSEYHPLLKLMADIGDANSQHNMYECMYGNIHYLVKPVNQQHKYSTIILAQHYLETRAIETFVNFSIGVMDRHIDIFNILKIDIEADIILIIKESKKKRMRQIRLQDFYQYGRLAKITIDRHPNHIKFGYSLTKCLNFHKTLNEKVEKAVMFWILIGKNCFNHVLNRDVVKLIAIEVWKSRYDPYAWVSIYNQTIFNANRVYFSACFLRNSKASFLWTKLNSRF